VGPALLTGRAAAVFHEVFRVIAADGHAKRVVTRDKRFSKKVGEQHFLPGFS